MEDVLVHKVFLPSSVRHEYLALLPGLAALLLAVARPLHKYVRAALAPAISAMAHRQMHVLAAIQRLHSPLLDALSHASAMSVTVEFYVALLPLLFWLGWQEVAMKLILGLSLCCFVCFAWKDLLCCPRPRHLLRHPGAPPVVVKESKQDDVEYGAPSGHVALSVCLNVYLVNELVQYGIVPPQLAGGMHACSALWILWIAFGRMYLGMHTPVDLATGALMGLSMLGLWSSVDELCLEWLRTNPNALTYSFIAFAAAFFHWPTGDEYTTSFLEAGVTFLGAAWGPALPGAGPASRAEPAAPCLPAARRVVNRHGVAHDPLQLSLSGAPQPGEFAQHHSAAAFAAKLAVGYGTVLVAKTLSKKVGGSGGGCWRCGCRSRQLARPCHTHTHTHTARTRNRQLSPRAPLRRRC
jgi:membrane-associated phospholipid phosphatase